MTLKVSDVAHQLAVYFKLTFEYRPQKLGIQSQTTLVIVTVNVVLVKVPEHPVGNNLTTWLSALFITSFVLCDLQYLLSRPTMIPLPLGLMHSDSWDEEVAPVFVSVPG